jgi:hypothetical protein
VGATAPLTCPPLSESKKLHEPTIASIPLVLSITTAAPQLCPPGGVHLTSQGLGKRCVIDRWSIPTAPHEDTSEQQIKMRRLKWQIETLDRDRFNCSLSELPV